MSVVARMLFGLLVASSGLALAQSPSGVSPSQLSQMENLQTVIDRGGPLIYMPKGTYLTDKTIFLRSNSTLFCEDGAIIEAAPGSFLASTDVPEASILALESLKNVKIIGCTIKGRKADYGVYAIPKPPYVPGEHRHCIRIVGSTNVTLSNVDAGWCGGDSIYIGPKIVDGVHLAPCTNITVKDSILHDSLRQGISVIAVENLLVQDCLFFGTHGASPQSGIDLEPERTDRITAVIRRCHSRGNRGNAYLVNFFKTTVADKPSNIKFESCTWADVPADQQIFRLANVLDPVGDVLAALPPGTIIDFNGTIWKK